MKENTSYLDLHIQLIFIFVPLIARQTQIIAKYDR